MILEATYSGTGPSSFPGKIRFMSRSNIGMPLVMESIPRGFRDG
jgi:hypothetical protein